MKNLCFVDFNISNMGGIERVLVSLCNELSNDYNVHLVSICGDYNDCHYSIESKVKCYNIGNLSTFRIRNLITKSVGNLINYIKSNNIDIVFMVGHFTPPIVLPAKLFVKSKFVFCDHGALINQFDDKKAVMFRKLASKLCDKTVVLTDRTRDDYLKIFKIQENKIVCIYNWLDDDMNKFINVYNVNNKKILSCGRFTSEKGYDILVDVAKDVFKKFPDWKWHIYGDGPEFDDIQRRIESAKLDKFLVLRGATDNMYEKYKNYGIYVMTSYREGLPLVLIEAKANHLPIVSFNCLTGPAEIVRDGVDGYLIDCYDKKLMVQKICSLIEDENKRLAFSMRSGENLNLFDKRVILDKWVNLINNL